jgi:hypothetical protein
MTGVPISGFDPRGPGDMPRRIRVVHRKPTSRSPAPNHSCLTTGGVRRKPRSGARSPCDETRSKKALALSCVATSDESQSIVLLHRVVSQYTTKVDRPGWHTELCRYGRRNSMQDYRCVGWCRGRCWQRPTGPGGERVWWRCVQTRTPVAAPPTHEGSAFSAAHSVNQLPRRCRPQPRQLRGPPLCHGDSLARLLNDPR